MNAADKVTSLRLILAPLFFVVYFLPRHIPSLAGARWTVVVLWGLFIVSEITDMIDGMVARKRGETSDFGRLYDPFADTLVQLTYFLCFVMDGILPVFLLLLVLYREFGILFVRNLMLKKGVALGARLGGKIKTVTYIVAAILALLAASAARLGLPPPFYQVFSRAATAVFALSVLMALISFADYVKVYKGSSGTP